MDTTFRMLRASSTTDIIDLASPSPSLKKRARTENAASSSAAPLVPNPEFARYQTAVSDIERAQ